MCVFAPNGINNQWSDIDLVWLVKQVLWIFLSLYDTCHDAINKLDGDYLSIDNTAGHECLPRRLRCHSTSQKYHPTVATQWSASVVKVSKQMRNDAFKGRLAFSFTIIIYNFPLLISSH